MEVPAIWNSEVEQKLKKLDRRIEVICNLLSTPHDGFNNDPFFDAKIMHASLFRHFKIAQLESYDGITNPVDHLESFEAMMLSIEPSILSFAEPFYLL